jgi:hypothetical protein
LQPRLVLGSRPLEIGPPSGSALATRDQLEPDSFIHLASGEVMEIGELFGAGARQAR